MMPKSWVAFTLDIAAGYAEAVANFLVETGAPGILFDEHGGRAQVTGHFEQPPAAVDVLRYCNEIGATDAVLRTETIEESNWAENWKAHFPPLAAGERLWIAPPWAA